MGHDTSLGDINKLQNSHEIYTYNTCIYCEKCQMQFIFIHLKLFVEIREKLAKLKRQIRTLNVHLYDRISLHSSFQSFRFEAVSLHQNAD